MNSPCEVSVICITYNQINYIHEALDSLINSENKLHGEDLVLASVNGAYDYLLENYKKTVINMQVYMPRI